jgi:hypothetical protein
VAHITHITPDEVGELTPGELIGALDLFDHLYRANG